MDGAVWWAALLTGLSWGALGQPCPDSSCGTASPVVHTAHGPIQGFDRTVEGSLVSTFWGLPFAQPPVGARRFRYPEPYTNRWILTRQATKQAPKCAQAAGGSEDCLYLNVYAPRSALGSNASLPVMFWLYGGGYTYGDSYENVAGGALYDGAPVVGRHNVIIVTSNYRLNLLGFNTFTRGSNGETGSQAMADQRMALQWTHDNIRSFGGDPSRVTIFGESAGAFSVMYHLVSPPSWTLFSKAIMQSGTSAITWFFQPKDLAGDMNEGWATAVGCPPGLRQLSCLQSLPSWTFSMPPGAYKGRSPSWPAFPVGPVVDGTEHGLLDTPVRLVEQGKFNRVPLLIGANRDDGSLFEPILAQVIPGMHAEALSEHDIDLALNWTFSPADRAKVKSVYNIAEYEPIGLDPWQKYLSRVLRDASFQCSDRHLASQWQAHGVNPFVYTLSFDLGPLDKFLRLGDFHGEDLIFVFRNLLWLAKLLPLEGDVQMMADTISCLWTSFARTGDPNGGPTSASGLPGCEQIHGKVATWPPFGADRWYYSLDYELFAHPKAVKLQADNRYPNDEFPSDRKCDMWDTVSFPWHSAPAGHAAPRQPVVVV